MKINKAEIYYVEKDGEFYTRRSASVWTKIYGDSEEPFDNCEEIEEEFQNKILELSNK